MKRSKDSVRVTALLGKGLLPFRRNLVGMSCVLAVCEIYMRLHTTAGMTESAGRAA